MTDHEQAVEGESAAAEAVADSTPQATLSTALRELAGAREALAEVRTDDGDLLPVELDDVRRQLAVAEAALVQRAHEKLVRELLPVLDDLERALQAASDHEEARLEDGVRLVHANFRGLLEREGLAEIETDGTFDPHVHEALVSLPSEHEEGTILDVHQKGYRLGDQVLRPARVAVAAPRED
jgi:molecular chaperone GrpE